LQKRYARTKAATALAWSRISGDIYDHGGDRKRPSINGLTIDDATDDRSRRTEDEMSERRISVLRRLSFVLRS